MITDVTAKKDLKENNVKKVPNLSGYFIENLLPSVLAKFPE